MSTHWNDSQPIYWQLKERTVAMILDGTLTEGEALPSVRTVASQFQLNPITVSKSYQSLVDEQNARSRELAEDESAFVAGYKSHWEPALREREEAAAENGESDGRR